MISAGKARTIVGLIGNVISLGLFASPIPTFIQICKRKAVEDYKWHPYLATFLNCAMWVLYGYPKVHPDSLLVVTINSVGLFFEAAYAIIFFLYSPPAKRKKMSIFLLVEAIFFVIVALITFLVFDTTKQRSFLVGIICIVLNVIMYASPLTVMRQVIKTKSVKYMPFTLSVANFCNGIVWAIYALLKFDLNVLLPNSLGALSGLIQLILYGCFYRTTNWDNDSGPDPSTRKSEVQMSSEV